MKKNFIGESRAFFFLFFPPLLLPYLVMIVCHTVNTEADYHHFIFTITMRYSNTHCGGNSMNISYRLTPHPHARRIIVMFSDFAHTKTIIMSLLVIPPKTISDMHHSCRKRI
jgi:hypothetical protein